MRSRLIISLAACGVFFAACYERTPNTVPPPLEPGTPETIGDLGGVQVRIPSEFARSVEYDGDPAILQPRPGPSQERTVSSRIRSFGFDFRYPDMVGTGSEEARTEQASRLPGNTHWIRASVSSGEDYVGGAGSTQRQVAARLGRPEAATGAPYHLLAERTCGLESYVVAGNDADGRPNREHSNAEDIFVTRDAAGIATTFIQCSTRPLNAAPCQQHFDLAPRMKARVSLQYRRGLLCEWQGLQRGSSQLILSFQALGRSAVGPALSSSPSTTNQRN